MNLDPRKLHGETARRNMEVALHLLKKIGLDIGCCILGGGTSLAARWLHRHSTDVDIFASQSDVNQAIQALGGTGRNHARLKRILQEVGEGRFLEVDVLPYGIKWRTQDKTEGSIIARNYAPAGSRAIYHDPSGMRLEEVHTVIGTKVGGRMGQAGLYMDRDGFDVNAAARKDKKALFLAFDESRADEEDPDLWKETGRKIEKLMKDNPSWAGTNSPTNRHLLSPDRTDLHGRRLWEETCNLLLQGPREYVRKLEAQARRQKDTGWSR